MSGALFEGSYLGDASRLPRDAVMECKICWSVYDPAQGCETWQVPPGTPFAGLPDFWRCPTCDAPKEQFMVVSGGPAPAAALAAPVAAPVPSPAAELASALEAAFRDVHAGQMRGLPIVNEALGVKAVGFREQDGRILGVLITPWFMNLIEAPLPKEAESVPASGEKERLTFPSGVYEFTAVRRATPEGEVPPYRACSLFSPMFEFGTMLQAIETAEAALRALMDPTLDPHYVPPPPPEAGQETGLGRRALFTGRGR